ncbi:putative transporter [Zancudomyces culisetae]|uniref:Putative transporter n=1 Tax=Zancudomyces culisetae TaxID=1213189 RepID=A0A1R1PZ41_ZANCU|nr:putative transporter [Zancudomyces culisetae]|eukprot:OMH86220.1 putative transporter [Zancudomyces culisetae]
MFDSYTLVLQLGNILVNKLNARSHSLDCYRLRVFCFISDVSSTEIEGEKKILVDFLNRLRINVDELSVIGIPSDSTLYSHLFSSDLGPLNPNNNRGSISGSFSLSPTTGENMFDNLDARHQLMIVNELITKNMDSNTSIIVTCLPLPPMYNNAQNAKQLDSEYLENINLLTKGLNNTPIMLLHSNNLSVTTSL